MRNYKIGIIGYGVVGKGIHRLFGDWVTAIYDPAMTYEKDGLDCSPKEDFEDLDMVVISVPTNPKESGEADTQFVWESLMWLEGIIDANCIILISFSFLSG